MKTLGIELPFLLLTASHLALAAGPYLFRTPTINATDIVFSYAGDLWTVGRSGGDARRLTAHPGEEINPIFSPDGKSIAFAGNYDGSIAVYVMPASGGVPKCLTWNHQQGDRPLAWTHDGRRILFRGESFAANISFKFFTVDLQGNFPEEVPLPAGGEASYSPDGSRLAYVPGRQFEEHWKRYRGGQMNKIWIANLADSSVTPLPREKSNDFNPMWIAGKIYFLSDRNGAVTLFSYDLQSRQIKQLIENRGFDFKSASAGPGAIAYEQFGAIGLYDLATGKASTVNIRPAGDLPETRRRLVDLQSKLASPALSPTGARAVFSARGEIFTIPAEKGDTRNLTNTPGAREMNPAWSPKGDKIAYFSDAAGEYELQIREQSGMGAIAKFALNGSPAKPAMYSLLRWSPDAAKVAYTDSRLGIWFANVENGEKVLADSDPMSLVPNDDISPVWSPDSNWLAYTKTLPNFLHAVWMYSLKERTAHQMTDGMSDCKHPAFDGNGRYLYFACSTNSGPTLEFDLESYARTKSSRVYLIVLAKGEASPFLAESDEENTKKAVTSTIPLKVDFDRLSDRTLALPLAEWNFSGLLAGAPGILVAIGKRENVPDTLLRFDVASGSVKTIGAGMTNVVISANGERFLCRKDGNWIVTASDGSESNTRVLSHDGLTASVEPSGEWRQIYHEAWRLIREFFYDPAYHGLDLEAAEKRYQPFLENLASRRDLNYLLGESLGNLTVGHLFIEGGDTPSVPDLNTGFLGADYEIHSGRYRFKRVYSGESWNPDMRAPLAMPGAGVTAGDYLIAVNGRDLPATLNLYQAFEGLADKQVVITVSSNQDDERTFRQVRVRCIADEHAIRYAAWTEDNRRLVDRLSGGRVAYLHMPDTGVPGLTSFRRYFYAQVGKEGAVIDGRFNTGGHWATDIMDYLRRKLVSPLFFPNGEVRGIPLGIYGPKVMLINEYAGSGGEIGRAHV